MGWLLYEMHQHMNNLISTKRSKALRATEKFHPINRATPKGNDSFLLNNFHMVTIKFVYRISVEQCEIFLRGTLLWCVERVIFTIRLELYKIVTCKNLKVILVILLTIIN